MSIQYFFHRGRDLLDEIKENNFQELIEIVFQCARYVFASSASTQCTRIISTTVSKLCWMGPKLKQWMERMWLGHAGGGVSGRTAWQWSSSSIVRSRSAWEIRHPRAVHRPLSKRVIKQKPNEQVNSSDVAPKPLRN